MQTWRDLWYYVCLQYGWLLEIPVCPQMASSLRQLCTLPSHEGALCMLVVFRDNWMQNTSYMDYVDMDYSDLSGVFQTET